MALPIPFSPPRILQSSTAQRLRSEHGARIARYSGFWDFYNGIHFQAGRKGRSNLVANYGRAIVDKSVAYLFARGIVLQSGEENEDRRRRAGQLLAGLADDTALMRTLLQAGANASILGDAMLKVFWDGQVRVVNLDPSNVFPTHAGDDPDHHLRVQVLSRLRPEEADARFGVALSRVGELLETWTPEALELRLNDRVVLAGPNPYGFMPFVHVPNLAPPNSAWGVSDLQDLIPLNRELDERMSDQADVIRYHADPPVVFKGVESHSDLAVGPGTVWDLPRDADVALLEWRGQAPAVDRHIDRVLRAIFDVAESPRSSFGDTEQAFSGVALETQLQPIVQRTLRKRIVWEPALRRLGGYMLRLAEQFGQSPDRRVSFAPYRVRVQWPPMLPRDDAAEASRHLALVAGGLQAHTSAMGELGRVDPAAELRQVVDDRRVLGAEVIRREGGEAG